MTAVTPHRPRRRSHTGLRTAVVVLSIGALIGLAPALSGGAWAVCALIIAVSAGVVALSIATVRLRRQRQLSNEEFSATVLRQSVESSNRQREHRAVLDTVSAAVVSQRRQIEALQQQLSRGRAETASLNAALSASVSRGVELGAQLATAKQQVSSLSQVLAAREAELRTLLESEAEVLAWPRRGLANPDSHARRA